MATNLSRFYIAILLHFIAISVYSQSVYFVDGYHGGIYGHYPVQWQTQFMADGLAKYPEWKMSVEIEPETWDTVKAKTPEAYQNFKNIATDSRVDFTNPTYAQPYCYNISGESIIRQFEYGIKKIHQHFPDVKFQTYSVEEPCFTSSLPQILKQFGFKYAVLKCPDTCWGGYTQAYGGELVNWIGADGTAILTVPRYACEELEENSTWQTKAWNNSEDYLKACFDYGIKHPAGMCFQDAGWKNGPWLGTGENIKSNSIYVTWTDYIENSSIGKTDDDWFFSQEDMHVNLMWGSQVLQKIGQEVRTSENKVIMAEKIGSMAHLANNYTYSQDELDDAWRTLMLAQHHDSWIVPYNRLNGHRTWAEEITLWTNHTNTISDTIIETAAHSFEGKNINKDTGYIRVYNTLGMKRTDVVSVLLPAEYENFTLTVYDIYGHKVPFSMEQEDEKMRLFFKADVPPFGYATYSIKKKSGKKEVSAVNLVSANDFVLENDMYRIIFDSTKGGTIKSLIAKTEGNKEYVNPKEEFALGELKGHFYEEGKFHSSTDAPATITVLKDNLLEKSIKIEGSIASHPFIQIVTIKDGQKRIDFDLTVNWNGNVGIGEYKQQRDNWRENSRAFYDDRFKLNVLFPTSLQSPQLYKDAPFDVCKSRLDNTHFNTWDSIKHNIILHWVDLVDANDDYALALFSDHTTSYAFGKDFPLGLTAQYSGIGLWGPDYKITRPLKMKYALVPHRGTWDKANIAVESNCWNEPLVCCYYPSVALENRSFIDVHNTGYELSAVKIQDDDILVRLFNSDGDASVQKVTFGFPVSSVREVDLREESIGERSVKESSRDGCEISISMPRFGLKTFLIKRKI